MRTEVISIRITQKDAHLVESFRANRGPKAFSVQVIKTCLQAKVTFVFGYSYNGPGKQAIFYGVMIFYDNQTHPKIQELIPKVSKNKKTLILPHP